MSGELTSLTLQASVQSTAREQLIEEDGRKFQVLARVGLVAFLALTACGGEGQQQGTELARAEVPTTLNTDSPTTTDLDALIDVSTTQSPSTTAPTTEMPTTSVQSTPETNEINEDDDVIYEYLPRMEGDLLSLLVEKGYPDSVEADYKFDPIDPEALMFSVARDLIGAINTRDYDSYAAIRGLSSASELDDPESVASKFDTIKFFFAPDPSYTKFEGCTETDNTVVCSGWVSMYSFWRNEDPANDETIYRIENPTLEGGLPQNSTAQYIGIRFTLNKQDGVLEEFDLSIADQETALQIP